MVHYKQAKNLSNNDKCFLLVDGGFSLWTTWTKCSEFCGTGTQKRHRTCNNPIPKCAGMECDASLATQEKRDCTGSCDGNYSCTHLVVFIIMAFKCIFSLSSRRTTSFQRSNNVISKSSERSISVKTTFKSNVSTGSRLKILKHRFPNY